MTRNPIIYPPPPITPGDPAPGQEMPDGLTLRDWLAAQMIGPLMTKYIPARDMAVEAYKLADALLAVRAGEVPRPQPQPQKKPQTKKKP